MVGFCENQQNMLHISLKIRFRGFLSILYISEGLIIWYGDSRSWNRFEVMKISNIVASKSLVILVKKKSVEDTQVSVNEVIYLNCTPPFI